MAGAGPAVVTSQPGSPSSQFSVFLPTVFVPLLIVPVVVVLVFVALIPIALVQRYRVGTARQRARGWLIAVNLVGLALSSVMFLITAALTTLWLPGALTYTLAGLASGWILGAIGLALTRWEPARDTLHYTPNRWLVLVITIVVTGRLLFGFWRAWQTWHTGVDDAAWVAAAGVAKSMAAGAVVLGYYFVYWVGVRNRLRRPIRDAGRRSPGGREPLYRRPR
jgi:hypothetical protein